MEAIEGVLALIQLACDMAFSYLTAKYENKD